METISLLASSYAVSPTLNLADACFKNGTNCNFSPIIAGFLGAFASLFVITIIAICILTIVGMWKTYQKAGQKGWKSIIPIYNLIVMMRIIKRPVWFVLLMFVPYVNIVINVIIYNDMAKSFGKGVLFTIGLIFLPFIFYPILGFDKSTYTAPVRG